VHLEVDVIDAVAGDEVVVGLCGPVDAEAGQQMSAHGGETPGQRPILGAYLGLPGWHPQRGSNPCLHLERAPVFLR
jgi:hypothetical protein